MTVSKLVLKACELAEVGAPEVIIIEQSPFRVGRKPDNDARVVLPDISGVHAEFLAVGGIWWVRDRSKNGTFLNGKRLSSHANARVDLGDLVHFATKAYRVVSDKDIVCGYEGLQGELTASVEVDLIMELVEIINQGAALPYFQPILDLSTFQPIGWESLGRAITPDGIAAPGPLFERAARHHAEINLSRVFRDAATHCTQCHHCWPDSQKTYLFLNIHPNELQDAEFFPMLQKLADSDVCRYFLPVIEVPESWVARTDEMQVLANEIHDYGMLLAYDDFGQGASRIPDLISAPPDFLKLDRVLTCQVAEHRGTYKLVQGILEACRELQVRTIAEGIETQAALNTVRDMGIELGQGYFFGKPQPPYQLFDTVTATLPRACPFVRFSLVKDPPTMPKDKPKN